jgi:hypothetical protein
MLIEPILLRARKHYAVVSPHTDIITHTSLENSIKFDPVLTFLDLAAIILLESKVFSLAGNQQFWRQQAPIFMSSRDRAAYLYSQAVGSLSDAFVKLSGLRWKHSNQPPQGNKCSYAGPIKVFSIYFGLLYQKPYICMKVRGNLFSSLSIFCFPSECKEILMFV